MPELSPIAQHWIAVVLIRIGFGSLAGMLARAFLPLKEPSGALATMTLGIAGSTAGLAVLSWLLTGQQFNPIGPVGFVAATAGALALLLLYALLHAAACKKQGD
jgi:uncharacterized membrane protein YeaQ/YmgE (transglycosylase-associated protein family)